MLGVLLVGWVVSVRSLGLERMTLMQQIHFQLVIHLRKQIIMVCRIDLVWRASLSVRAIHFLTVFLPQRLAGFCAAAGAHGRRPQGPRSRYPGQGAK